MLLDPKSRKVIISEDPLLPYRIKEAICRVLFTYFQIPSITFLSAQVLALASTGLRTGLVIDIGWHTTRVLPVKLPVLSSLTQIYELRPLNPFVQVSPLACAALHSRLGYLLARHTTPPLSNLSFSAIQDFLLRGVHLLPTPPIYPDKLTNGLISNDDLPTIYGRNPSSSVQWFVAARKLDVEVPTWICTRAAELFFEGDRTGVFADNDEVGLATSTSSCLLRLPKDVRAKVMQAIVVVGGGATIPGLRSRLQSSLETAWDAIKSKGTTKKPAEDNESSPFVEPPYVSDLSQGKKLSYFRFIQSNPTDACFMGASLLGDVKVRGLTEISRESFNSSQGRNVGDWTFVGGSEEQTVEDSKRRSRS
jgi:actin-related protein 10